MKSLTNNRRGFLLIEAMVAAVILSVAAMGIVSLLLSAQEQQEALQENSTAVLLARQLMEEIAARPLGTYLAGPSAGPRANFVTAWQYNGYSDSTGADGNGISTIGGQSVHLPSNYARTATLSGTTSTQTTPPYDVCVVTVTVTTPSGKPVSLSKWLTNVTWGF